MKKLFEQNSIETKFNFIQTQINFIKSSLKINLNQKFLGYQNQIDLLKSNYLSNHPDKKEKNGFVQISKSNKVINLADLKIGDEIELQTPKYIASCTLNKLVKQ